MPKFSVDYVELNMAGQLLDRQTAHTEELKRYLDTHCRLDASAFGWLLQMLHPMNDFVVDAGKNGATLIGNLSTWAADNSQASLRSYMASDEAAHREASALATKVGTSLPPFPHSVSSLPALGGPASAADADYGTSMSVYSPDWDYALDAAQAGSDGVDLVAGTLETGAERLGNLTSRGGVVERTDPGSYLVVPATPSENFVEDLRWNAGFILGSIDWAAELILGYSVLEEYIYKPFGGDWHAIGRASGGWTHGGQSLMEIGSNFSGLPGQVEGWRGDSSVAFQSALTLISSATVALSYAFDAVSGLVDLVSTAAKTACKTIASAIGLLESLLLKIIPQLSIPVAGWITATATALLEIKKAITIAKLIYSAINLLIDAISEFIAAKEKMVQAAFMAEDLINSAATRAVRS